MFKLLKILIGWLKRLEFHWDHEYEESEISKEVDRIYMDPSYSFNKSNIYHKDSNPANFHHDL